MKNRFYQDSGSTQLEQALLEGHRGIVVVMPTGAGKTVWFANGAKDFVIRGKRVLIGANRVELVTQAENKLIKMGVHPSMILAGKSYRDNSCYVAMIETLHNQVKKGIAPYVDVAYLDEIHIQQHDKIVIGLRKANPNVIIIGVTATPTRPRKYPLSELFSKMIVVCTTRELVEWGYLVNNVTWRGTSELDPDEKIKMKGDDFDQDDVFKHMDRPKLYGEVVEKYIEHSFGKKAICFNSKVEQSIKMTDYFRKQGIESYHIDGNTNSYDRNRLVLEFAKGKFPVLNNCHIFTTGFDDPGVQTVIANFMTVSIAKWLQANGRGSRANIDLSPYESVYERLAAIQASDKPIFTTLDHGTNWLRNGHWIDDRAWSLLPAEKKIDTGGVSPIRECLDCGALIPAQARVCPSCKAEAPPAIREPAKAAAFVIAEPRKMPEHLVGKSLYDMTIPELIERQQFGDVAGKPYQVQWIIQQLKEQAKRESVRLAQEEKKIIPAEKILDDKVEEFMAIKGYNPYWKTKQNLRIDIFDNSAPLPTFSLNDFKL